MPQLGKFNLLEGCFVTAEWDMQLSYYWSFCHSGFVFWQWHCEVCLPRSGSRCIFQGTWRCVGDLLSPSKVWPFISEMFTLRVSHTTTDPTSFWVETYKMVALPAFVRKCLKLSLAVFTSFACISAAVPSKTHGRASAPVEVRGKAPADSRVSRDRR